MYIVVYILVILNLVSLKRNIFLKTDSLDKKRTEKFVYKTPKISLPFLEFRLAGFGSMSFRPRGVNSGAHAQPSVAVFGLGFVRARRRDRVEWRPERKRAQHWGELRAGVGATAERAREELGSVSARVIPHQDETKS